MESNPAVPGGSLASKPTWSNSFGCSTTSAFFCFSVVQDTPYLSGRRNATEIPLLLMH